MKISLQNAISFFLTGSAKPENILSSEPPVTIPSKNELDDFETTPEKYEESQNKSHKFSDSLLNIKTDLNTTQGQFRFIGLSAISSLFSGIGAGLFTRTNMLLGIVLACLAPIAAAIKNTPLLTTKFAIDSFGGNLIRNVLHVFDSVFSRTGEKAANYKVPTFFASALSLGGLIKSLAGASNKNLRLPIDTLSGTFGRTAIHSLDSMLSSKATELFNTNEELGSFLAGALGSGGFLLPESIRQKTFDYEVAENLIAYGSTSFTDSLFTSIGNAFSSSLNNFKRLAAGIAGVALGLPILGSLINKTGHEIPFNTIEGKLSKSILHMPESFSFNLGNTVGNSILGIPLSLGFCIFTYLTCLANKGKSLLANIEIPKNTLGSQLQRIPFMHFMWSLISASAMKLSKSLPAPLVALAAPMISFQLGERFKNISSKYNETKGLMIRSSLHFLETIFTQAGYKTGRIIAGSNKEDSTSGSLLNGFWLTDEGRLVPSMAIGKQIQTDTEYSLKNILISSLGGVAFSLGAYGLSRFIISNKETIPPKFEFLVGYLKRFTMKLEELLGVYSLRQKTLKVKGEANVSANC